MLSRCLSWGGTLKAYCAPKLETCAYGLKTGLKYVLASSKVVASGLQSVFPAQGVFVYLFKDEILSNPYNIAFTCGAIFVSSYIAYESRFHNMVDEDKNKNNQIDYGQEFVREGKVYPKLSCGKRTAHLTLLGLGICSAGFSVIAVGTGGKSSLKAWAGDSPNAAAQGIFYSVVPLCMFGTGLSYFVYNLANKSQNIRKVVNLNWQKIKEIGAKKIAATFLFSAPYLVLTVTYALYSGDKSKKAYGLNDTEYGDALVYFSTLTQLSTTALGNIPVSYNFLYGDKESLYFAPNARIGRSFPTLTKPTYILSNDCIFYLSDTTKPLSADDLVTDDMDLINRIKDLFLLNDPFIAPLELTSKQTRNLNSILYPLTCRMKFAYVIGTINVVYNALGGLKSFVDKAPKYLNWSPDPYDPYLMGMGIAGGLLSAFHDFAFNLHKGVIQRLRNQRTAVAIVAASGFDNAGESFTYQPEFKARTISRSQSEVKNRPNVVDGKRTVSAMPGLLRPSRPTLYGATGVRTLSRASHSIQSPTSHTEPLIESKMFVSDDDHLEQNQNRLIHSAGPFGHGSRSPSVVVYVDVDHRRDELNVSPSPRAAAAVSAGVQPSQSFTFFGYHQPGTPLPVVSRQRLQSAPAGKGGVRKQ